VAAVQLKKRTTERKTSKGEVTYNIYRGGENRGKKNRAHREPYKQKDDWGVQGQRMGKKIYRPIVRIETI